MLWLVIYSKLKTTQQSYPVKDKSLELIIYKPKQVKIRIGRADFLQINNA